MKINNEDVNIDDLFSKKYMHNNLKNGIYLSEYQIEILKKYSINPEEYGSITELIYEIDEVLENEEAEDLDLISKEIIEFNYYTNTNK